MTENNGDFKSNLKNALSQYKNSVPKPQAADFPPPIGREGECVKIEISLLEVDDTYQRPEKADHSRKIAKSWNWNAVKVITVARRGNKFYVVDGQHIVCAARMRGDIAELWCYVIYDMESRRNEAIASYMTNNQRRRPTPIENHQTLLIAKDEDALEINRIVTDRGYEVATTKKERCPIKAVGTLYKIYRAYDGNMLDEILRFHSIAWPDNIDTLSANALKAMTRLIDKITRDAPTIDIKEVAKTVNKASPDDMLEIWEEMERFKISNRKRAFQMSVGIARVHDKHTRLKKILPIIMSEDE